MSTAAQVRRVFADLTRYPEDILDPGADLEADLGIDSVKRVEIMGRLREALALPAELRLPDRGLNTIGAITQFLDDALRGAAPPAPALAPTPVPVVAPGAAGLAWAERVALPAEPAARRAPAPTPSPTPVAVPAPAPAPAAPAPLPPPGDLRAVVVDTLIDVLQETRARLDGGPAPRAMPRAAPRAVLSGAPDLRGRTALVTGSGHGLGAVLASALARQGCTVVVNSFHSRERGEATAARIRAEGGDAVHIWASVAQAEQRRRLFAEVGERYGGLDIFVSNASNGLIAPTDQITEEHWEKAFRTNVVALHQGALLARPLMRARGGGKILCISSPGAGRVIEHFSCMGSVKAAQESLVRYLAVELGPENIQVNAISAGPLYGELLNKYPNADRLIPYWETRSAVGRLNTEEEIVGPALSLLSPMSDVITGAVLQVDHGGSLRI